jgi:transcriptional regulator GlxA family with amidase domain
MSKQLEGITDWPVWAQAASYSVHTLAENCGVTTRTLERHIKLQFGKCPEAWLGGLQMQRANELLPESACIKDVAMTLGYKYDRTHHFARDFKEHSGYTPSQYRAANRPRA